MKMIIAGVVLTGVVLVGGWFFVNKDSKSMKAKPVAMEEKTDTAATMEKKDAPTEPMKKVEESTADEWSTADMKKDKAMTKNEVAGAMEKKEAMMGVGGYETYAPDKLAFAKEGTVVLFFRASWCPVCRAMDADIRAHLSNIPKNVLILDVDYDNAKDLKTKYGVTYQHTYVEVDAMGNQITKWSGGETLTELLAQVK